MKRSRAFAAAAALGRANVVDFHIEKLLRDQDLSAFDCGNSSLTAWLQKFAWVNQQPVARVQPNHSAHACYTVRDPGVEARAPKKTDIVHLLPPPAQHSVSSVDSMDLK